jgi:hypothetical protein
MDDRLALYIQLYLKLLYYSITSLYFTLTTTTIIHTDHFILLNSIIILLTIAKYKLFSPKRLPE